MHNTSITLYNFDTFIVEYANMSKISWKLLQYSLSCSVICKKAKKKKTKQNKSRQQQTTTTNKSLPELS